MSELVLPERPAVASPFDLDNPDGFARWRERKLRELPASVEQLVVEVADPARLTPAEHAALLDRLRRTNMVIYASRSRGDEHARVSALAARFGLHRLDCNWLADEEGLSQITVSPAGTRADFIPYTNRAIRWHSDGYYNEAARRIRAMVLHCVRPAAQGGENALIDHELIYLLMRSADPELVRALQADDALTIPARCDADGAVRPAMTGPVFEVDPVSGRLHMRYTARTQSIAWKADAATAAAVAWLNDALAQPSRPGLYRARLEAGMGLLCANVLHDRSAFVDDAAAPRLLLRARYLDGIDGLQARAPRQ